MGLSNILGVLVAVVSVSALAADPPVPRSNVSVNVNPTSSYYTVSNSTLRLPNGVSVSPNTTVAPVVSRYPAGLQQTIPAGVTIDAIKKSAPLPVVVRSTTQSLKGAAGRCLKSGRCNVGLLLAGEGLNRLFDGLDWVMGEGGKIQKKLEPDGVYEGIPVGYTETASTSNYRLVNPCSLSIDGFVCVDSIAGDGVNAGYSAYCPIAVKSQPLAGYVINVPFSGICYYGGSTGVEPDYAPVSDADIDAGVAGNYVPEPTDWPALTPELELDDVEITSAPTLQGEPVTKTVYDAEGNPQKVTVTNTWYDFLPKDNPSPQPAIDMKTREETKTYENGELTGTTTTESTASGGGAPPSDIDIPTDCEFMPTVCAFLEWYRDDDDPEEPDLSVLIDDRDFTESYTISGGSKQCPPPYELALPFIGQTYYLSFDFACDFASKIYYFIMAAAYIFAAYITIGVARNG